MKILNIKYATYKCSRVNFNLLKISSDVFCSFGYVLNNINIQNISITIEKEIILNKNLNFGLLKTNANVSV